MDLDIKPEIKYPPLTPIFLTGLDIIYNANHKAIWDSFSNNRKPNQLPINFQVFPLDHSYPKPHTKRINYEWYIPKGILKRNWFSKHQSLIPSVVVFFYELDWDDVSWDEKKLECGTRLNILKEGIQNRNTKIIVVLIQSKSHFPPGEDILSTEKAADFCNTCNVPSKHLFVLPFSDLFYGYTLKLEGAFYEVAQTYYSEKIKNIKSHASYLNKNLHQALIVRYNVKAGFFNEMKQDSNLSSKCYIQAYECLAEMRVPENNLLEVKVVGGYINYKICKLYFDKNSPLEAIVQFKKHLDMYKGKIGTPELSFEHHAWMESQYKYFGELFQNAVGSGLIAIQTQHPGYYYLQAAQEADHRRIIIRTLFQQMTDGIPPYPSPDPLQGQENLEYYGQRPWKQGNLNTEHFDINKEKIGILALQLKEWATDHSGIIIPLLRNALTQFETYRSHRLKNYLLTKIGIELFNVGDYAGCLTIANTLIWEFRRGKWWLLFTSSLLNALKCAYVMGDAKAYVSICIELFGCCSRISNEEKFLHQQNFCRILYGYPPDPANLGLRLNPSTLNRIHSTWETILSKYAQSTNDVPPSTPTSKIIVPMNDLTESFIKVGASLTLSDGQTIIVSLNVGARWESSDGTSIFEYIRSTKLFYTISIHKSSASTSDQKSNEFFYDFSTGASQRNEFSNTNTSGGQPSHQVNTTSSGTDLIDAELSQLKLSPKAAIEGKASNYIADLRSHGFTSLTLPIPLSINTELLVRGGEVIINGIIVELSSNMERNDGAQNLVAYLKWTVDPLTEPSMVETFRSEGWEEEVDSNVATVINIPPRSDPLFSALRATTCVRGSTPTSTPVGILTNQIFEMEVNIVPSEVGKNYGGLYEFKDFEVDLSAVFGSGGQACKQPAPTLPIYLLNSSVTGKTNDASNTNQGTGKFKRRSSLDQNNVVAFIASDRILLNDYLIASLRNQNGGSYDAQKTNCLAQDQNIEGMRPNFYRIKLPDSTTLVCDFDGTASNLNSGIQKLFYVVIQKIKPDNIGFGSHQKLANLDRSFNIVVSVVSKGKKVQNSEDQFQRCIYRTTSITYKWCDPFAIKPYLLSHIQLKPLPFQTCNNEGEYSGKKILLGTPTFVLVMDLVLNPETADEGHLPPILDVIDYELVTEPESPVCVVFDTLKQSKDYEDTKMHLDGKGAKISMSFIMAVKAKYFDSPAPLVINSLGKLRLKWATRPPNEAPSCPTESSYTLMLADGNNSKDFSNSTRLTFSPPCPVVLNLSVESIDTCPEPIDRPLKIGKFNTGPPHVYKVHDNLRLVYTLVNTSPTQIMTGRLTMGLLGEDGQESNDDVPSFFIWAGCKKRFNKSFEIMPRGGVFRVAYNAMPVHLGKQALPKMAVEIDGYPDLGPYTLLDDTIAHIYIHPSNK